MPSWDRVAGGAIPADDDPSALAALRSLRAGFAKSFAALNADRKFAGRQISRIDLLGGDHAAPHVLVQLEAERLRARQHDSQTLIEG